MILSSKKIDCEYVDVSASHDALEKMRELTNDAHALPPQIVNGDDYCGVSLISVRTGPRIF